MDDLTTEICWLNSQRVWRAKAVFPKLHSSGPKKSYQFGLHGKKYYNKFSNQIQLKTIDLTPSCRKHIFWWLGFSQWYFMPCTFLVHQIVFIGFMVRKQFFGFLIGDLIPRYLQMCHFYTISCLKFKYLKYIVSI